MTIGPREVMRSNVDGGLSGPANPMTGETPDCGCSQLPCPRLAKFATRRLFVGLLCSFGIVQAAAQSYLHITSPTVSRRFQLDPYYIDWILTTTELTPAVFGLLVAYWGDRFHRAAWIGGLGLLQSASFVFLLIPHFTRTMGTIEETENVTHISMYSEDNPELCLTGLARLVGEIGESCYETLGLLIAVQILSGMSNVAYYALGISYLDDNTKKRHVASLLGVVVAVKVIGLLLGYVLAWACLRLDSTDLSIVESYREQIGAWWLGWPILAFFMAVPALFISWLPRRLPSEVVEQAAASILDVAGRTSPETIESRITTKVGGTGYYTSLARLLTNKIVICTTISAIFFTTAVINFSANENIFLESRYYVPRPNGLLMGFGDPFTSRLIVDILKPVIVAIVIILSGIIIAKARPSARSLTIFNIVALVVAATIIYALVFATCEKRSIAGERKGSLALLKYCNKNCRCSKDAEFRPICDGKSTFNFYSPCHAGCKVVKAVDGVKIYGGCSCVEEMTGSGNQVAVDGPCSSDSCQYGWLVFEIGTLLVYCLVASSIVGQILILLRSVYLQDKALAIGFWLTFVSAVAYVPGKFAYTSIANATCKHWGRSNTCHLHNGESLGDYLCYLTSLLLILGAGFEILVCWFSDKLQIYEIPESELPRSTEMQRVERTQAVPLLTDDSGPSQTGGADRQLDVVVAESPILDLREMKIVVDSHQQQSTGQLKYGPLGPGDRRTTSTVENGQKISTKTSTTRNNDTDDELDSSSDDDHISKRNNPSNKKVFGSSPRVAYKPLELDSDVESDLSSVGPRSRKRVSSGIYEDVRFTNDRPFPNPDHYEERSQCPRESSTMPTMDSRRGKSLEDIDATYNESFSRTYSFEFTKKSDREDSLGNRVGDFNEVGIPVMGPLVASVGMERGNRRFGPELTHQVLLPRHQKRASQERLETIRSLLDSVDDNRRHRLDNETLREEDTEDCSEIAPPVIGRPPSRGQASSGFGSSPDVADKHERASSSVERRDDGAGKKNVAGSMSSGTSSPANSRTKASPLSTAL